MRLLCKQAQIDTQNMYLFSSLLEFFNRLKERILAKKKDSGKLKECKARVRHRERDQGRLNKLFVCTSVVHPGLALCLASRVISLHNDHCRSCISIFTAVRVAFKGVLCLVACSSTGLIMQGMGKTERGEQGRDIDLTSLRSTMPASGPLQVSILKKAEKLINNYRWIAYFIKQKHCLPISLPFISPSSLVPISLTL